MAALRCNVRDHSIVVLVLVRMVSNVHGEEFCLPFMATVFKVVAERHCFPNIEFLGTASAAGICRCRTVSSGKELAQIESEMRNDIQSVQPKRMHSMNTRAISYIKMHHVSQNVEKVLAEYDRQMKSGNWMHSVRTVSAMVLAMATPRSISSHSEKTQECKLKCSVSCVNLLSLFFVNSTSQLHKTKDMFQKHQ